MLLHIRTGRRPKGGEVTIEKIRRTNECLWHGEEQAISSSSSGRQAGRQPRHKAARTKELRRCTIRARDGRLRVKGDRRAGFKDSRRFTKVLEGQQGKYTMVRRTEGRKEGPTPRRSATWGRVGWRVRGWERERWRFLFKRHQRACRKFSSVPVPPAPLVPPGIIRGRVQSTRIHAFQAGVPEFRTVV